jgi:hypothetical protein
MPGERGLRVAVFGFRGAPGVGGVAPGVGGSRLRPQQGAAPHLEAGSDRCSRCRRQAVRKRADVYMDTEPSMPHDRDGVIDLIDYLQHPLHGNQV